jgi:hypothetical protein
MARDLGILRMEGAAAGAKTIDSVDGIRECGVFAGRGSLRFEPFCGMDEAEEGFGGIWIGE